MTQQQQQQQQQQQWSPFECLAVASLTQSGLLQKEPDEVELFSRQPIELRSAMTEPMVPIQANGQVARGLSGRDWVDRCENLALTITTHRIVLTKQQQQGSNEQQQQSQGQNDVQARFIHLSHLLECRPEQKTSMFASPKVLLTTYSGDFLLVFRGSSSKQDRDDCIDCVETSVRRLQEWQANVTSKTIKAAEQHAVQKKKVGVDAILSQSAYRHEQAVQVTEQAFAADGDAETLLKEAGDLVQIIKKYVGMLDKQQELDSQQEEDATKLAALLQDMGMASALVKSDFRGREEAYYQQTARQLADFVRPKLVQAGGFMTLTDVYCLYNRARASNLISPEDLLQAVSYMPALHLGMSQRHFPSGLTVLQDDAVDDEKSAALLVAAADMNIHTQSGITADQAAKYLKLSAVLAHEQLLAAELAGALVRDETLESLSFFPNRFQEFVDAL
jgi:ESCRT-II complex subunit VPS36